MEWQPIETIPMDTVVLVGSKAQVVDGAFQEGSVFPCLAYCWPARTEHNITYSDLSAWDGCGGYEDVWPKPTHWMPLPEAPK